MNITIKVFEVRTKKGLTLEQLENLSGIAKSHISNIERGIKNPTVKVMCKLAKVLNCKLDELIDY